MPTIPIPKTTLRYKHHPSRAPPSQSYNPPSSNNAAKLNANPSWSPGLPYDSPASYPKHPSFVPRVPHNAAAQQWEVRITAFELFIMLLAMLSLILILSWLSILLLDYLAPRLASRRRIVRAGRKLSRQLQGWRCDDDGEQLDQVLPLRSGGGDRRSERYSERVSDMYTPREDGVLLAQGMGQHGVNGVKARSRAGSATFSRKGSVPGGNGVGGGAVDVEKAQVGQGEWVEGVEMMEARRRSGVV